jgi:DNA topoisomerase I
MEKEANRFIQNWPDEKVSIENGRWGPFIRFKKDMLKLPRLDGKKMEAEDAALLSLEEVKKIIEEQVPDAFAKKAPVKKAPAKKAAAKKAPGKK